MTANNPSTDSAGSVRMTDVFNEFYTQEKWRRGLSDGTRSGRGSTLTATGDFRKFLIEFVTKNSIRSIFDAPCGDFHWMKEVPLPDSVNYLGGDVASRLVADLNGKYAAENRKFIHFDIVNQTFPAADLWICRDCMIHLPLEFCVEALRRASEADIKYAILSSYYTVDVNLPGKLGGYRPLNLFNEPFNFPEPLAYCDEFVTRSVPRRFQGVWRMEDIRTALGFSRS